MPLGDFRSVYMPYCLKRQSDGSYVVLNREYKPVGFNTTDFVDYDEFPVKSKIKDIGRIVKKLSYDGSHSTDIIYLYHDGCVPIHSKKFMEAYLGRLALLAKRRIDK